LPRDFLILIDSSFFL